MKNLLIRSAVSIAAVIFSITAVYAAGVVDTTYGTNGKVIVTVAGAATDIHDMLIQPDGKLLVAGAAGAAQRAFISRYQLNGTLDLNFGQGGVAVIPNDILRYIYDIEIQPDGKIVGVGLDSTGTTTDFFLIRLTSSGALDAAFGNGGVVVLNQDQSDTLTNVAVQSDGRIVATGTTNDESNPGRWVSMTFRFTPAGTLDPSFNGGGVLYHRLPGYNAPYQYSRPSDVEVLNDGRILTGGTYNWDRPGDDEIGYYIQMIRGDGTLDTGFGAEGMQRSGILEPLAYGTGGFDAEVLADGTVAIASNTGVLTTNFAGSTKYFPQPGRKITRAPNSRFAVLKAAGGNIPASVGTYSKNSFIGSAWKSFPGEFLAVQPDGKVLVGSFDNETMRSIITRGSVVGSQGTRQANFNSANFNSDDKADLAVYRASDKFLRIYQPGEFPVTVERNTQGNFTKLYSEYVQFTLPANRIYREATVGWNKGVSNGGQGYFNFERIPGDLANFSVNWGISTDLPYGGDFNGDGLLDVGVFRPSNGVWYGFNDSNFNQQSPTVQWGANGDKPVPADYDYDGITDYAIYRPSNGTWWVRRSSDGGFSVFNFGVSTDIPLTGDFDGDGRSDYTVYRPSEGAWYQLLTTDGFRYNRFGISTDIPVPGDYDGDGKWDIAVYRSGIWHVLQSRNGYATFSWGGAGEVPVTARYDQ